MGLDKVGPNRESYDDVLDTFQIDLVNGRVLPEARVLTHGDGEVCSFPSLLVCCTVVDQLAGRGTKERTPTRMVIILQGKFYLEKYAVS